MPYNDISEEMKLYRITLGECLHLNAFRRRMLRIWSKAMFCEVFGATAVFPLKDVEKDCRRGTQRCHECDDFVCGDNLWMHDLVVAAERGPVDSNEAKLLYLLQELGVRTGPHDRRVWPLPMTLTGRT